jgi:hypothetical protein
VADIPRAVLSEHFEERMQGRRLRSAMFLTYQFEPAFFEQQVLPVFLDVPVSHAEAIRLIQLEDTLRSLPGEIAVYYDANGLNSGDGGSAKLDVRRIPVRHRTGVFHPKNVLLLLEDQLDGESGHREQTLVVASLSANLTRAGWWENVECCHVEEITERSASRLRDDLIGFLESLRNRAAVTHEQRAVREILAFLRRVQPRLQKSAGGHLHTHFFAGREPLPDFLDRIAGEFLGGSHLEVISPFFDDAPSSQPLEELIARFHPKEVRVFLPRSNAGEALCRGELYDAVRALPNVHWGHLPQELLRISRQEETAGRAVHAKLYRFFTQNPKREICFIGSANLTRAAHQAGGNVETGFLVDQVPPRRPAFWLSIESHRPSEFQARKEDEPSIVTGGTRLNLTYHWDRALVEAYWDSPHPSSALRLTARGLEIGPVAPLPPRTWTSLPSELVNRVRELLAETSLFLVHGEADVPLPLLVQEEGMSHKPSLLFNLSAADILRYWALLTPAQRAAFVDTHAPEIALTGRGADLVTHVRAELSSDTLFDQFAGIFHSFGCVERTVRAALDAKNDKDADYRIFGRKYDSLGTLLERIRSNDGGEDDVNRYVTLLCARQLARELERDYPSYWASRPGDAVCLNAQFANLSTIRERLVQRDPAELGGFLDWFDRWFLKRAEPVPEMPP